jgi:hypothetical protein
MNLKQMKRYQVITALNVMIGFSCAAIIYMTAGDVPVDPFAEFENSKRFVHEVERMGGKSAVVANDLSKWFAGLWQGESLSYTVACITIVIAAGYYFIASGLAAEAQSTHKDDPQPPLPE